MKRAFQRRRCSSDMQMMQLQGTVWAHAWVCDAEFQSNEWVVDCSWDSRCHTLMYRYILHVVDDTFQWNRICVSFSFELIRKCKGFCLHIAQGHPFWVSASRLSNVLNEIDSNPYFGERFIIEHGMGICEAFLPLSLCSVISNEKFEMQNIYFPKQK